MARWRGARQGDRTASRVPPPTPARGGEAGGWSDVRVEERAPLMTRVSSGRYKVDQSKSTLQVPGPFRHRRAELSPGANGFGGIGGGAAFLSGLPAGQLVLCSLCVGDFDTRSPHLGGHLFRGI